MGVKSSHKIHIFKNYGLGSAVFIAVFIFSLTILAPIYVKVTNILKNEKQTLINYLEKHFSLSFSYESLSPSLFSGIRLRNLSVIDTNSHTSIMQLHSVYITYNFFNVRKKGLLASIDAIILDGGVIRFDKNTNALVMQKIQNFIAKKKEADSLILAKSTQKADDHTDEIEQDVDLPEIPLPPVVQLKNYKFIYADNFFQLHVDLKSALMYSQGVEGGPQFFIEGQTNANIKDSVFKIFSEAQTRFIVNGKLSPNLQSSSTQIRFEALKAENYSVSRLAFLVSHHKNDFTLRSIRNLFSYNLTGHFNIETLMGGISFSAQNFNPLSMLEVAESTPFLQKLQGALFSGKYDVDFKIKEKSFSYTAKGDIFLPKEALGEELSTQFSFNGDEKKIALSQFSVFSNLITASFQGDFDFITMQPQGYAHIESLKLPNGNTTEAEFFIDRLAEGFMVFVPQLFLDDRSLTALQATFLPDEKTLDFSFEAYDFSHYEYDIPGKISLEGSLFMEDKYYIQSSLSLENFFIDTIIKTVSFFSATNQQWTLNQTSLAFSSYIINTDTYISTDFSDFLLNIATTLITSTARDREYAIFSFSGSGSNFTLSQLELLIGGQLFFATGEVFFGENFSDVNFSATITANSVPYNMYATYTPGQTFSLYGDYGLTAIIDLSNEFLKSGAFTMTNFPIPFKKVVFGLSTHINFSLSDTDPLIVNIERFTASEITETIDLKPHFGFSGIIMDDELFFDTITYSDTISSLSGSSRASWKSIHDIFNSLYFELTMADLFKGEKIEVSALLNNTDKNLTEKTNMLENIDIFANASVSAFNVSRFFEKQNENDQLTANITISGFLQNLIASADIQKGFFTLNGQVLEVQGGLDLEQDRIQLKDFSMAFMNHKIENINTDFSLQDFNTNLSADYYAYFGNDFMQTPVQVLVVTKPLSTKKVIFKKQFFTQFEYFNIDIILSELSGNFFAAMPPITFSARRRSGRFDISGGYDLSILGYLLDTGELSLTLKDPLPVQLTAFGTIKDNIIDIAIDNFKADLSRFNKILNFPFIAVNTALLEGKFHIGGLFSDPDFSGEVFGKQVNLAIPDYVGENLINDNLYAQFVQNDLIVDNTIFNVQKGQVSVTMKLSFDRWLLDNLDLHTRMIGKKSRVMVKYKMPMFELISEGVADLDISVQLRSVSVTGDIFIENADAVVSSAGNELLVVDPNTDVSVDLKILLGKKVQAFFPSKTNPLIRGLIEPQTPVEVQYDSASGDFDLRGDINLRGGEILYVKKNFHLKEGRVLLNESQDSFDPLITVRAEIKERDVKNRSMTIILSVIQKPLSEFTLGTGAQFSSVPVKTEQEIMKALGQVFVTDTDANNYWGDVVSSIADYGVQVALFRKVETQLRNWLNLDIFSLRLPFVQNTVSQLLNQNATTNQMTFGNFFDGSTIYIGKYFGDVVYVDTSLLLEFDKVGHRSSSTATVNGINFQPSVGLELESPFGNIKWALSPEIGTKLKPLVQYNSISLSWKFIMD
ncbi:MAG: translocation/assembly module TamB domain-containing protein [Treponemataceae bacterium]